MTAISEGFLFGLGSSVHCAAMCGPIALAMGADARAALAYHAARAGGYCTAGAVLGALGSSARLASLESTAPWIGFVLAAGLVLGALGGERLLGAVPGSARVVRACFARARRWPARLRLAALGALTPLLPCGVLWAFYGSALLAGGPAGGAGLAAGFVCGSAPLLALSQWQAGRWRHRLHGPNARFLLRAVLLGAAVLLAWRSFVALQGESCCA